MLLSVSFINPSSLFTLGKTPSFNPIINIAFTLCVLDLSVSPTVTPSWLAGIFPKLLFFNPILNIL